MTKVFRAIAIVGNLAELIVAGSILTDVILKIRGNKPATSPQPQVEDTPLPDNPIAA